MYTSRDGGGSSHHTQQRSELSAALDPLHRYIYIYIPHFRPVQQSFLTLV